MFSAHWWLMLAVTLLVTALTARLGLWQLDRAAQKEQAHARVLAQGGRAMSGPEPIESRPGLFVVFLRDPEGNVVELVQYDDVAAYRPDLQAAA